MNNKQQITNKGFTLVELMVAVAILAMMVSFASVIFSFSINSYRVAGAHADIMRKLRAITDQLNHDFAGLEKDAPLLIWFEQDTNPADPCRYDQMMFFAAGDFQSVQLYYNGRPDPVDGNELVTGTVARIHYGQAEVDSVLPSDPFGIQKQRTLARRQHILTADDTTVDEWPRDDFSDFDDIENEWFEHDSLPLVQWKTTQMDIYKDKIIPVCFDTRPQIDMAGPATYHKLMCDGVASLAIQWAYWDDTDKRFYWFPNDSHFGLGDEFGVVFNVPNANSAGDWFVAEDLEYSTGDYFDTDFFPDALKFTFTIYDSKGIIEKPKTFTHIVYLRD